MASTTRAGTNLRRKVLFLVGAVVGLAFLLVPWWRNHALLIDFYDYGLVMAASLRIQLGERPYVDFATPIQTLHFLQAVWAESIFGPRYLSLTYANAIFISVAFVTMAGLLKRPLGSAVALLVAAAVVVASAGQHTIVWHNAMGVTFLALVVWLTALPPQRRPFTLWRLVLICAILWLGGMTKITYQVAALAFAGLFAVRDGWIGGETRSRTTLKLACYFLFGVAAPVATELIFTGASLKLWWENVVVTPSGRLSLLQAIASPHFYFQTPHDYYKPLHFPFVGAWGLAMTTIIAAIAAANGKTRNVTRKELIVLATGWLGAWICGSVLLASNFDIAYMAGAAWLVFAAGLALASPVDDEGRVRRRTRLVLAVGAVTLALPAGQASWAGTRALWGHYPLERGAMPWTDSLSERFSYIHGLSIPEPLHSSLQAFTWYRDERVAHAPAEGFFFGKSVEWMVRVVPEARHRGVPLWLHEGTSYNEAGAVRLQRRLSSGDEIRTVVSLEGWNGWTHGTEWYLNARYTHRRIGPLFHMHELREDRLMTWKDPLAFALNTASTAYSKDWTERGGPFVLTWRAEGSFVGSPRSGALTVNAPLSRITGVLVVRRRWAPPEEALAMTWRLVAISEQGRQTVLREEEVALAPQEQERTVDFSVTPQGGEVSLEIELPLGEKIEAGFREMHTEYVGGDPTALPALVDESLEGQPNPETWSDALFAGESLRDAPRFGAGFAIFADQRETGPQLLAHTRSEVWFRIDPRFSRLRGEFGLLPPSWLEEHALPGAVAQIAFYRPGRLLMLMQKELRPKTVEADRETQTFDVALNGEPGWIGLFFNSTDPSRISHGHSWWRAIEAR